MRLRPENETLAMCVIAVVIIVLAACLGGCATTQPLQVTAPCPRPNIPTEPHYPIQYLKKGDSSDKVAKAYAASFGLAYDYIHQQLLPRLGAYKGS